MFSTSNHTANYKPSYKPNLTSELTLQYIFNFTRFAIQSSASTCSIPNRQNDTFLSCRFPRKAGKAQKHSPTTTTTVLPRNLSRERETLGRTTLCKDFGDRSWKKRGHSTNCPPTSRNRSLIFEAIPFQLSSVQFQGMDHPHQPPMRPLGPPSPGRMRRGVLRRGNKPPPDTRMPSYAHAHVYMQN